ncbi:RNA polymerase sigma-54 factor [Sandarakinorhabdus cyanobacteriorum]|uniref:RNA polymerase sigma-54 factor n=1 Tax=Sandarakinorhabdus cyanobacteriorum TaxID=1981098 RepID=A0A255YDW7_9SPHN|nr:RNA polymerase factor sigma-54 [Sandarakinorhabdus cyanobacteriorum]OYQ26755.1 RNA polymerase sigma-54 factor [Sandarakinorhabdus cyanobacteriorum]
MGLGPRLEIRQSQQLVMTPQLQLAIKLLTVTNVELEGWIGEELERNPLLASGGEAEPAEPVAQSSIDDSREPLPAPVEASSAGLEQLLREGVPSGDGTPLEADYTGERFHHDCVSDQPADWSERPGSGGDEEGFDFDRVASAGQTLAEILEQQAASRFDGMELAIARFIINGLDECGYLVEPVDEIADRLDISPAAVEAVLAEVQMFDPVGVAARTLSECLIAQARAADRCDPAMHKLLSNLDLVARGDMNGLMRLTRLDREDIVDMIRELKSYDPKPGLRYSGEPATPVVPDVFVTRGADGAWQISLNQATLPRLIVDRDYHAELASGADKATNSFLDECVSSANWLLKALDQRAKTIVKVATEIVKLQQGFFENGVSHLKPLTLKTVADLVEMHESTVSRVTSNKYLLCERGQFELKYFFTSGVASGDGEAASALAVKDRIARLIAAEGDDVLSDDKLVELLQGEGFDIARRTVAKYREALGLGSSVQRRRARAMRAA